MSAGTFALSTIAFLAAIGPYGLLFRAALRREDRFPLWEVRLLAILVGLAGFCSFGTLACWIGLRFMLGMHVLLAVLGIALVPRWWKRSGARHAQPPTRSARRVLALLLLGSLAVRLAPILLAGDTTGGADAGFHAILAKKILIEGRLTTTWAPVASVPVVYPRAVHVLCAFMTYLTGKPVENSFNALFPWIGMLSTAGVYVLARILHPRGRAARLSAFAYAFLAYWGSLDYFRWGGLPNAVGMLLLCTIVWIVLRGTAEVDDRDTRRSWTWTGGVAFMAIYQVHHHSALVASMVIVFALVFATRELRARTTRVLLTGLALTFPVIVARYLSFVGLVGATNVLQFPEHPIPLWNGIGYLGPPLVALFAAALLYTRGRERSAGETFVLAWVVCLALAFVVLEYGSLATSLVFSGGTRFTTAFVPSRMITDMVYPMAVLCGAITGSGTWERRRRLLQTALLLAALVTCTYTWIEQRHVGATPELKAAGRWLRDNTPQNALVLGQQHYLAYYSWRENDFAPLPASEPRNDPDIQWKRAPHEPEEWRHWSRENDRPVYFVLPRGQAPAGSTQLYVNPAFAIHQLDEAP